MSSSGLNGVIVSVSVWLLVVVVIAVLLGAAQFLEGRRWWVCNGLAFVMAWVQSELMANVLGLFVLMVTWWSLTCLAYMRATGYTPRICAMLLLLSYRRWRKLEWSGEFVHPEHDRI